MDYLTFLSEQLFAVKPRIEAPLEGLWRLEETRQLDCRGGDELVYAYAPYIAERFCLDVRGRDASFYNDCRLCPGDAPCSPVCNTRDYYPCTFDPRNGLFVSRDAYYMVLRLTSTELLLLELGELGQGIVARSRYRRIG